MALTLGQTFGTSAALWMTLQKDWELSQVDPRATGRTNVANFGMTMGGSRDRAGLAIIRLFHRKPAGLKIVKPPGHAAARLFRDLGTRCSARRKPIQTIQGMMPVEIRT